MASITLDWTDPELLRELLRRRFLFGISGNPPFDDLWREIAVSHIRGEETSQYLIERSLMRPRALIELVRYCRGHAVNLGHQRIDTADIDPGEEAYSSDLLNNVNFEIRDVMPGAGDLLYEFIEASEVMSGLDVRSLLERRSQGAKSQEVFDLLLWYGFVGVVRDDGDTTYIHSVKYDLKRLKALVQNRGMDNTNFRINPAFWRALEVKH